MRNSEPKTRKTCALHRADTFTYSWNAISVTAKCHNHCRRQQTHLNTLFGALCSAQVQKDDYECANFCHACIVQKFRFACVTGFHILNLLVNPCHTIGYHGVIEK